MGGKQNGPMQNGRHRRGAETNANPQVKGPETPASPPHATSSHEDLRWLVFAHETLVRDIQRASQELDRINNQSAPLLRLIKPEVRLERRAYGYLQFFDSLLVRFALTLFLFIGLIYALVPEAKSTAKHFFRHEPTEDKFLIPPGGFPELPHEMRETPMAPLRRRTPRPLQMRSTNAATTEADSQPEQ